MDNLSKANRHKNMQSIRSTNTIPEIIVIKELLTRKIYFAKHVNNIIGKPDIVFRRKKIAIFIDSDFWHCNPLKFIMPKTNTSYWRKKIHLNQKRDIFVNKTLSKQGWKVLRFWESEIKTNKEGVIENILLSIGRG